MQFTFAILTATAASASALVIKRQSQGDGPYGPVSFTTDEGLTRHTIYAPSSEPDSPMPVLVWGNGACSDDGTSAQNFLAQIASYGFVAISSGTPGGNGGSTTAEWMTEAVEWAVAGAGGLNVDTSSIMAAGFSCGGTEAYEMHSNDAVSSIGIFNSGLLGDYEFASQISKPIMYALGGPDDIAYENGERDYAALPESLTAWKGNLNSVGHGGTYGEANGGLFAEAAANWMLWLYKGDAEAGAYFADGAAASSGWSDAVSQNIDGLSVPIGDGTSAVGAGAGAGNSTVPVQGGDETTEGVAGGEGETEVEAGDEQSADVGEGSSAPAEGEDASTGAPQDGQSGDDFSSAPADDRFTAPAGQQQQEQGGNDAWAPWG
ncbi:hypothetical protein Q7P37_002296 [Cladosporium fusiforme]